MQAKALQDNEQLLVAQANEGEIPVASAFEDAAFALVFEAHELEFVVGLFTMMAVLTGDESLMNQIATLGQLIERRDGEDNIYPDVPYQM